MIENESVVKNRYNALRLKKILRKHIISKFLFQIIQSDEEFGPKRLEKSIKIIKDNSDGLNLIEI